MKFKILLAVTVALTFTFVGCNSFLQKRGLHPDYDGKVYDLKGKKALVVTTSHGVLSKPGETTGDSTGVFASEMTIPYYEFLDANMEVQCAFFSILGKSVLDKMMSFILVKVR